MSTPRKQNAMRPRKKVFLGCSLGAIAGIACIVIVVALLVVFGVSAFTGAYFDTPWDRAKLRRVCDPVKGVPTVVEAHRSKHGNYPASIDDLDLSLPGAAAAKRAIEGAQGFRYSSDDIGFRIYKKLNWDGGILYESLDPRWLYSIHDDIEWSIY